MIFLREKTVNEDLASVVYGFKTDRSNVSKAEIVDYYPTPLYRSRAQNLP